MIPINMFSKLARSRSQVALATKTLVTSGALWKQKQSGRKSGDDPSEEGAKKQQQGCGTRDDGPEHLEEHDVKKQHQNSSPVEEHEYLEEKRQGEGSSCGPIQSPDTYLKKKHHKTRKMSALESDDYIKEKDDSQNLKSRGCSCPPYATPKYAEENNFQKSTYKCPEANSSKQEDKSGPGQSRSDPCESRKSKSSREEDTCKTQKRNDSCETNSSPKNRGCPERNKSAGDDTPKKRNYCGPVESSYKDACREDKDLCSQYEKQTRKDPCGPSSNRSYRDRGSECEDPCRPSKTSSKNEEECPDVCQEKSDPCEPIKPSRSDCLDEISDPCCPSTTSSNLCQDECEQADVKKEFRLDPCKKSRRNECPETKEEVCLDEQKQNDCPEDPCKKEIKIPELSPCCEVNAAKECICKLQELQRQWEEVIAAQEMKGKDDCHGPQEFGKADCQQPAQRVHKRSNMIFVVLSAILAAVVYYTYNADFEPEELFLEEDEVKKDDNDVDD